MSSEEKNPFPLIYLLKKNILCFLSLSLGMNVWEQNKKTIMKNRKETATNTV
jgi:hypothetical protein